jgi:RNA polymerase sigma-70 factor (ECF subfamily)
MGVDPAERSMSSAQRLIVAEIPRLRRYARALTRDREAADDLVQDCLERAWGRFHLWRRHDNLRAWLFTIMHNLHANHVRRAKSRPATASLDVESAVKLPSIRAAQEDNLEARGLVAALELLPDEQRTVLLLVALEQFSYEETSQVLGIPIGTVMSRLSRARERLRRHLAGLAAAEGGRP